jgi:hypothetical protein
MSGDVITVTVGGDVTESISTAGISPRENQTGQNYKVQINMTVQPQGNGWLVNEINIKNQDNL